jgi:hypothetical protein
MTSKWILEGQGDAVCEYVDGGPKRFTHKSVDEPQEQPLSRSSSHECAATL